MVAKNSKKNDSERAEERKVNSKLKIESLIDAIVDNIFTGNIGDELIVVKQRDGKIQKSICTVKKIEGEEIHTWDETKNQWYIFSVEGVLKHGITVKKLSK